MTRTSPRPAVALALVAALLAYVGCARTIETPRSSTAAGPAAPATPAPSSSTVDPKVEAASAQAEPQPAGPPAAQAKSEQKPKLFDQWAARPPAGVLVISGEQEGYLQPCGCTDGQLGGLGRRYDLVEKLKAKGWPVAAVDLGNLIHDPAGSRGGPEQEKVKFDTALKALAAMNYQAVALGPEDLKLGVMETLGVLLNLKGPRFLAANLVPGDGFEATVRPTSEFRVGPVAVGVTAVIDPASFQALADPDKAALLTLKQPDDVLPGALASFAKGTAIRVLLVQGPVEEGRRLAEKFPNFDLVVSRSRFEDPDERAEVLNGGKTLLINVGRKGKYAGMVALDPGSTPKVRYFRQPLDGRSFREAESMRVLIDEEYQAILKAVGVVEKATRNTNLAYPAGATYAGAESCQSCHPNTFAKWSTTKHARAYLALTSNPKRNREFDAECISCHTTGFPYKSGFVSTEATSHLKGNQCENCHGPGSLHNAEPDNLAYRKPMAMTAATADSTGFCTKCHDADNDPHFAFASYYAQIFHKGLDTYDDPKVHQKQPKAEKVAGASK